MQGDMDVNNADLLESYSNGTGSELGAAMGIGAKTATGGQGGQVPYDALGNLALTGLAIIQQKDAAKKADPVYQAKLAACGKKPGLFASKERKSQYWTCAANIQKQMGMIPQSTPMPETDSKSTKEKSNVGLIIGIVAGVVVVGGLVTWLVLRNK